MTNHKPARWTEYDPYLSPEDLGGKPAILTISQVETVDVYDQREKQTVAKPVLHFRGQRKYLILSPTNRKALLKLFGNEITACIGQAISLRVEKVKAFGEEKRVLRIAAAPVRSLNTATGEVIEEPAGEVTTTGSAVQPTIVPPLAVQQTQEQPIREPRELLAVLQARGGQWGDLNDVLATCRETIQGFRGFPPRGDVKAYAALAEKLMPPTSVQPAAPEHAPAPSGK